MNAALCRQYLSAGGAAAHHHTEIAFGAPLNSRLKNIERKPAHTKLLCKTVLMTLCGIS